MRAVVTRVKNARVDIDGITVGKTDGGFLVLLGVAPADTEAQCDKLADKVCGLRVFEDENEKMNLNLAAVGAPCWWSPSLPSTPTASPGGPALPERPGPKPPFPSTSGSWPSARGGASMWSTGNSARTCRSTLKTTAR